MVSSWYHGINASYVVQLDMIKSLLSSNALIFYEEAHDKLTIIFGKIKRNRRPKNCHFHLSSDPSTIREKNKSSLIFL